MNVREERSSTGPSTPGAGRERRRGRPAAPVSIQQGAGTALPLLSNLVDVVAEGDATLLDELEALVREKRRGGGGRRDKP